MFAPSLNLDLDKLAESEDKDDKKKASDKADKETKAKAEGSKGSDD
jgi:hypothetical protein